MVRRLFGLWLIVLIVLPWSAPFPTCDLADLFGSSEAPHGTPASTASNPAAVDDGTACLIPAIATTVGRLKPTALPASRAVRLFASAPIVTTDAPTLKADLSISDLQLVTILRLSDPFCSPWLPE